MKVRVYWNFFRKCWSVVDCSTGLVCARESRLWLRGVTFKVSEAGRQRVLRDLCKNVHAWACGTLDPGNPSEIPKGCLRVTYNPYRGPHFVDGAGKPILAAESVLLEEGGCVYIEV